MKRFLPVETYCRPWYSKPEYPEGHVCLECCTVTSVDIRCGPSSFSWKSVLSHTHFIQAPANFHQHPNTKPVIMLILNAKDIVCFKARPLCFEYGIQMWSPLIMHHFFHLFASISKFILIAPSSFHKALISLQAWVFSFSVFIFILCPCVSTLNCLCNCFSLYQEFPFIVDHLLCCNPIEFQDQHFHR